MIVNLPNLYFTRRLKPGKRLTIREASLTKCQMAVSQHGEVSYSFHGKFISQCTDPANYDVQYIEE